MFDARIRTYIFLILTWKITINIHVCASPNSPVFNPDDSVTTTIKPPIAAAQSDMSRILLNQILIVYYKAFSWNDLAVLEIERLLGP